VATQNELQNTAPTSVTADGVAGSSATQPRIASWDELQHELLRDSWNDSLRRYRSKLAFRGTSNADYDLRTSLVRLGNPEPSIERHLLRNFRKYAHSDFERTAEEWYWVALGQHHGLPTRLLDWTYSPHVALHFVTSNTQHYDVDGAIWCLDYYSAHSILPIQLQQILKDEGSFVFTAEMLSRFAPTLRDFDEEAVKLTPEQFVVMVEPPSFDPRIVNQFGLFSMMSTPTARLDEWLTRHPHLYRKLIIPAELKLEIRDKLDQSNITERVLFPGLDGLSTWLARHYAPLGPRHGRPPMPDAAEAGAPT
jgi:hypothetical protein